MSVSYSPGMILGCVGAGVLCILLQFLMKKLFEPRQYNYVRDLLLSGVWMLLAIWFGPPQARFIVGASFLAGIVGLTESYWPNGPGRAWRPLRGGYFLIGAACALLGPSISFISFVDGEYLYLTPLMSFIATSLWFTVFPIIVQQLDGISGLAGHVLAVTFSLMLMSVVLSGQEMQEAFFMSFAGLVLLGSFWSRFSNVYRQAGRPLSAMWGALAAGTAILGVSKGIVFGSMLYLSLGLFAIPLAEASLHLASLALSDPQSGNRSSHGTEMLYRKLLGRGLDHPDAVRLIAGFCALIGTVAALSQYPSGYAAWVWWGVAGAVAFAVLTPLLLKYGNEKWKKSPITSAKPFLWGVYIDNMSLNYALARARALLTRAAGPGPDMGLAEARDPAARWAGSERLVITGAGASYARSRPAGGTGAVSSVFSREAGNGSGPAARLVSTVNALGMDEAVRDAEYRRVLRQSAMVLSDGVGLLWGLRFLGMPIQERVTGIDFAEQLCRMAAVEGWPVYFLGSRGNTALDCAEALAAKYPGLIVAGARDGYFDMNDPEAAEAVARSGAKILFVAMGIPRQEKWVTLHADRLGTNILAVGVGGAFDVLSGHLKRAPAKLQKFGLEWLFRLCQEPFRWKKDLRLIAFVVRILATRFGFYIWREEEP